MRLSLDLTFSTIIIRSFLAASFKGSKIMGVQGQATLSGALFIEIHIFPPSGRVTERDHNIRTALAASHHVPNNSHPPNTAFLRITTLKRQKGLIIDGGMLGESQYQLFSLSMIISGTVCT